MQLIITPRAETQLEDIFGYGAEHWGVDRARRYTDDIIAAFERITTREIRWRPLDPALGLKGFRCLSGHHYIYWRATDDAVTIVAVLHERMNQGARLADEG